MTTNMKQRNVLNLATSGSVYGHAMPFGLAILCLHDGAGVYTNIRFVPTFITAQRTNVPISRGDPPTDTD